MSLVPLIPPPPQDLLPRYAAYIVAFTLNGPVEAYSDFIEEIKACDGWFNYIPGFWIVVTRRPMADFSVSLRSKIRISDWLLVMPAKGPVAGWLPPAGWQWLNKNLRNEW